MYSYKLLRNDTSKVHVPVQLDSNYEQIRYDTIEEFNVDSKAEYTA